MSPTVNTSFLKSKSIALPTNFALTAEGTSSSETSATSANRPSPTTEKIPLPSIKADLVSASADSSAFFPSETFL